MEALDILNAKELTEMRSFAKPPKEVVDVMATVLILLSPGKVATRDRSWNAAQQAMKRGGEAFLQTLKSFDKENIQPAIITALQPYLSNPNFNGQYIASKSKAAANLCDWVVNIVEVCTIFLF